MERDEIIIRSAIMHILDSSVGMPVLSDALLENNPDLNDFIRNHIYKIASGDDLKSCLLDTQESYIYGLLTAYSEENMISFSQEVSKYLYTIMNQNIEIPSGDFIVVSYQYSSQKYLAFLKLNYKETLVHYTDGSKGFNSNLIVKQTATLPSGSTKLSEAVLIRLSDFQIQVTEKKYTVNGVKTNYLSKLFLQCQTGLSSKAKLNLVTKAVEQINQKYFEEDFDKHLEAKSIIQNEMTEQGSLNVAAITEKIYGNQPEIKEEFEEKLEKYNLHQEEITPQNVKTIRRLEKQYLTTDCGIEINIPMEEYNNPQNIEFLTNPDGTISVLIKNINHIHTK
ncbi:MAG: nucleoid-associated protein [Acetivibrio sp.]